MSDYCIKCILKNEIPEVTISKNGECNYCKGDLMKTSISNYKERLKKCIEFDKYKIDRASTKASGFDCLLMLSGGKDSIYMLYNLIKKDGIRPLAFTMNHPYESKDANKNIEKVINTLGIDHVTYTLNLNKYKTLMKKVLTEDPSNINNKAINRPCSICTSIIMISAYVFAYKLGIPYILYCADPHQSTYITDNIKIIISDMINMYGIDFMYELFDHDSIEYILNKDESASPVFIFPYTTMLNYNPVEIISELKELNLYESSPIETHCSLYGILNYYSYKRYDALYYARELSILVRNGEIDREQAINYVEKYKDIILNIATKEELSLDDKKMINDVVKMRFPDSPGEAQKEYEYITSLRKVAQELDIKFEDI